MSQSPFELISSGTHRMPGPLLGQSVQSTFSALGLPSYEAYVRPVFEAVRSLEKQGVDLSTLPTCPQDGPPNETLVEACASIDVTRESRQQDLAYSLASRLRWDSQFTSTA
jgi:hypothetical protein